MREQCWSKMLSAVSESSMARRWGINDADVLCLAKDVTSFSSSDFNDDFSTWSSIGGHNLRREKTKK